jgi:non-specific serine/threonine protein kinase
MRIVYNLYPFNDGLYLPGANLVRSDRDGYLTHFVQRATLATAPAQGVPVTPVDERLLAVIERLLPKTLEVKFRPPKARAATPLADLLANPETKTAVETYIFRELDAWLNELVREQLPLTFDLERQALAKDLLVTYATDDLLPHLSFDKSDNGVAYSLQLGSDTERWRISQRDVTPLSNTDPAWLLADYTLYRVPGINGRMIQPFRTKDTVQIPVVKVKVYFKQFVAKKAAQLRLETRGFDVVTHDNLRCTRLEITENVLEQRWPIKAIFEYEGVEFWPGERRDRFTQVHFSDNDADVTVSRVVRNSATETAHLDLLVSLGLQPEGRTFRAGEGTLSDSVQWLTQQRKVLETNGFKIVTPQIEGRQLTLLDGRITLRSQVAGDWFDLEGWVELGHLPPIPFKALLPNLRRGDPYYPLSDGTFFLIPQEWFARYADLAGALKHGDGHTLHLAKALYTLLPADTNAGDDQAEPVFQIGNVDFTPSPLLQATLRPYQLEGVRWLIGHYQQGLGACLADDMGLGKTLQTIAVLLHAKEQLPVNQTVGGQRNLFQTDDWQPLQTLVILPASLVFNWQKELQRFAPSLFVYVHTGPKRLKDVRAIARHDVVLTTYHTVRQDLSVFENQTWQFVILDESQQIKNRSSEVSKVVRGLQARHKISLSGTPIENSLADLWTQMEFINPDTLGSYNSFKEQFQVPIEKANDEVAKQRLFTRVRPFFLRRTKELVAPELPAKTEQVFYSEMAAEQRKLYETVKSAVRNEVLALVSDPKSQLLVLQALTRLRQLANHPVLTDAEYTGASGKFDDVLALWDTVRRAGHKVLFFSSFEQHLRVFQRAFDAEKTPYAWLTGSTDQADRARQVERFQEDPQVQAFFMTIKAGGVGLNLTAADYIFLLDPWWNPAIEEQAIARAHRIGQTRPVTAIRFLAQDSIEEKIRALQERKSALGAAFFASGEDAPRLTREDLEEILN